MGVVLHDVYDPSRCNGTVCVECVDGEYCEPCRRGFDSDNEDREDKNAGDECYGSRLCKTLTLIMAGGGSHWWRQSPVAAVTGGTALWKATRSTSKAQWGMRLVAKEVGGISYLRLVLEGYEVADDEHEVQSEEDM
jgi:hypothetical protein